MGGIVPASKPERPIRLLGVETGDRGFLNRCLWDLLLSVPNAELPGRGMPLVNLPLSGRESFTPARGFTAAGLMLALREPPSQTAARRNPARADVSLRQAENLSFSRLPGSNFRLFWAITLQLLPVPAWRAACASGTGCPDGGLGHEYS